jgi:hypothetical protein
MNLRRAVLNMCFWFQAEQPGAAPHPHLVRFDNTAKPRLGDTVVRHRGCSSSLTMITSSHAQGPVLTRFIVAAILGTTQMRPRSSPARRVRK